MKIFTLFLFLSFSLFASELSKAPFIGFADLGCTSGSWHRDWQKNLLKPVVNFYANSEAKGGPKYTLNKSLITFNEFLKEQETLNQVQSYNQSKDDTYLIVKEESEIALRVGEKLWVKKEDVYYTRIDGEKFKSDFNAVKITAKGFYKEPYGEVFYPKKAIKKLKMHNGDAVVDFIDSKTINGVIWLQFTNFNKITYGDKKGESWKAWTPAFDSKGKPLFYYIGY